MQYGIRPAKTQVVASIPTHISSVKRVLVAFETRSQFAFLRCYPQLPWAGDQALDCLQDLYNGATKKMKAR